MLLIIKLNYMGYFEARKARWERNDKALRELAKAIIEKDNTIEVYHHEDQKNIEGLHIFKGDELCYIHFGEVPYRWTGPGNGSADVENLEMPYTVEDVLNGFHKLRSHTRYNDKKSYLRWYSFLTKFNG
jgi:hypothetical protein